MMDDVIDYSSEFPNALAAQGKGSNFLAVFKLDQPCERSDGKKATFEICYRWLSQNCQSETDQAFVCVQGSEVTYFQRKELKSGFF